VSDLTVGVLLSRVRVEEKLLLEELERRGIATKVIDDRELVLTLEKKPELGVDVVLERCIQHSRALYALAVLETWGIPTVNTFEVADVCGNKLLTTMRLIRDGVPSPRTRLAFTPESALAAQRPRRRRVDPGAQGRARHLHPLHLLHPGVRAQAGSRHPRLRRGR
jgi:[lysine-biosynthesis-protein LysW]--L-2-aminoadipate ligase